MPIKVVRVNTQQTNFTRYIGRDWAGMKKSPFHNPFPLITREGTRSREDCLLLFIEYWYGYLQADLRAQAVKEFSENEVLGCWCKPLACHGDIIAAYVNWKRQESQLCLELS